MRTSLRTASLLFVAISLVPLAFFARPSGGTPLYAARMGLACASCHFDPNGGGPRNAFGFAFARNRHSNDPETEGMFKGLDLTNKVSDQLPLFFSINQRLMTLVDDNGVPPKGIDRSGFFDMESQIHLAFQPHPRLTLVYTTDGFSTDPNPRVTREAWGMIGLGADHYLRAGVFRSPFGLRMDDHTTATRNGFTEFQSPRGFALPYDPRIADQGVEVGGSHGDWQGRVAFTNGTSFPLGGPRPHAQTFAGKLAYHEQDFESGVSGFDEWDPPVASALPSRVRASRWGYYGLAHRGAASLIGEVVSGTDQIATTAAGPPRFRVNRLGWFVEGDYQANRACNFRLRYDRLEGNRVADTAVREQSSYNRYALEGEVVPVPFTEIRWTLRLIDPVAEKTVAGVTRDSEKQAYVQFHFSY
ncbi:MAG TPA: hypothetical protein VI504_15810 [Candidatus Eisenbacteria bacterium]|jgi:hypothetical protein